MNHFLMKIMSTSYKIVASIFACAAVLSVSTAKAQTYKPDWATKVVLPSAGSDITKQFTIQSGTMSGALSWTLPITAGGAGYILTTNGAGVLSWADAATGVTLAGDANGPAGTNAVTSYNGGTTFGNMAHEVSSSVSITGGSITGLTSLSATSITGALTGNVTGDVTGNLNGNVTGNVTGGLTGNVLGNVTGNVTGNLTGNVTGNVTGGLTGNVLGNVTGNVTGNLTGNVTGNVTGGLTGNVTGNVTGNLTGNVTGNLNGNVTGGTGSFTDLTATGNVTLPAGSVSLASLALTNGHITVGDVSSHAADVAMSGDAAISNAGLVTVSKYNNGTSFGTMAAENSSSVSITGGTITGTSISGSTGSFTNLTATGTVDFTGATLTLPAGSVSLASLALTNGHITVGDVSSHAADVAISGDAAIDNTGNVTVSKYNNGTSFGTMAAENSSSVSITGGTITGVTISGGSLSVGQGGQVLAAGQTDDLGIDATKSSYLLNPAGTATLTGLATGVAGRMVVLVNATSFGITLKSGFGSTAINQLNLPGGADIILGQGGTATFIYDGTANNWRLISAQ
jgi:trimeric autotransporter adhesin